MKGLYFLIILGVMSCRLAVAQSIAEQQRYLELNDRITFHSGKDEKTFQFPPKAMMNQITEELRNMVTAAIQRELLTATTSSDAIQQVMSQLQGNFALRASYGKNPPNVPYADVSDVSGVRTLLAAFAVLRGGSGSPQIFAYLQFYSRATGVWKLVEETGAEFQNTFFRVAPIRSAVPNEVWYLVWGKYGGTGGRVDVRLYGFDGWTVRTVWQRDDLAHAMLTLSGDEVKLVYSDPRAGGGPTHWDWKKIVETFRPSPTVGLERISIEYPPR